MQDNNPDRTDKPGADFTQRIREDTKRIIRYPDEIGPSDSRLGLKKLFTKIIDDLSINERKWKRLMDAHLRDPLNGIPNNTEDHVQARSAMNKNLITNEQMTWRVLCRALRFLRIKRFRFSLTLVHNNDTTTEHGIWMNLRNAYSHLEDDDDPRSTYNRIPTLEIRDDSEGAPVDLPVEPPTQSTIHVPPPIDFEKYRRSFPPVDSIDK